MEIYVMEHMFMIIAVLGVLTFLVVVITEMIKDALFFRDLPTKLTALIISFAVVCGAMAVYLNMAQEAFVWWYLVAAFFASFIVGYLSINGWDNLFDIWSRFVSDSKKGWNE